MVPDWKSSPQGKFLKDFSNEELNEGMTYSVEKMSAIVLKKRVVGYGNRVESPTDVSEKLDYLSKQISALVGIALGGCLFSQGNVCLVGVQSLLLCFPLIKQSLMTLMHSFRMKFSKTSCS